MKNRKEKIENIENLMLELENEMSNPLKESGRLLKEMVDYLSYRELISYEAMLISIIRSYVRGECDISWGENQTHEGQIKLFKNIITELHEKRTLGLRKHGSKSYDVLLVDTLVLEEENWEMKNFIKGFG